MLDEKREYVLWDSYTGKDIESFDTRRTAMGAQRVYEFNGEYNTRIRTVVSQVEREVHAPVSTESKGGNEPA